MNIRQKLFVLVIVVHSLLILSTHSSAEPTQLFLDPTSEAVRRRPLEIEILALNENGEIEENFIGKRELRITVQESGRKDESYYIRSKKVSFKKGKTSFTVENSEEETLDVEIALSDPELTGTISLFFEDKDIFPPDITDIYVEDVNIIKLEFNEELEEESAQEFRNYKAVTNEREVFPESIEYHRDYVYLKFEEHFNDDEEGYIELQGVKDLKGNEVRSGLRSPDFVGTCSGSCMD